MSIFTFLLLVGTLLQFYVFWRALSLPLFARLRAVRLILIASGFALWLTMALSSVLHYSYEGHGVATLEAIGMGWLASLFLTSLCFLLVDLVTGFGWLMRRAVPLLRAGALVAGVSLAVVAIVQGMRPPAISYHHVRVADLPAAQEGMVLVALSDLHLGGRLGADWLSGRVNQVQQLHPDMIVLLGDIFEGHGPPLDNLIPEVRRLSAPMGVWAVPGNHESFERQPQIDPLLASAGIVPLRNRWVEIKPGLILAGVEDLTVHRYRKLPGNPLKETLRGFPAGAAAILLSHSPLQVQEAAASGVDLMLSGHTHDGQIWPFTYVVHRMYPYMAGKFEIDKMQLIVTRGTGTWGPRMRLWRRSEILCITLHR